MQVQKGNTHIYIEFKESEIFDKLINPESMEIFSGKELHPMGIER